MEDEASNVNKIMDDIPSKEPPKPVKKKPMTDKEREELAAKLDADLENFIGGLEKRRYTEGWPEDRWQEEMEKHPFFMTKLPEEGEEMSPLVQGLQQLKYDETENTPSELAVAYKDDGNFNFKCKNYRFAILGYTEGLRKKCGDPEIEAQLYNNRAAAHYFLKNWRSCIEDCKAALKLKPDYPKAKSRLAQSYFKIEKWDECLECLEDILAHNKDDSDARDMKARATHHKTIARRDERKEGALQDRERRAEERLMDAFKARGIKMIGSKKGCPNMTQVHFVNDRLVWPVFFLYPDHNITDFVQEFCEDTTFTEHLKVMLETPPPWDEECRYRLETVHLYYENRDSETMYPVRLDRTLGDVLALTTYVVNDRTPSFFIVLKGSKGEETLVRRYK